MPLLVKSDDLSGNSGAVVQPWRRILKASSPAAKGPNSDHFVLNSNCVPGNIAALPAECYDSLNAVDVKQQSMVLICCCTEFVVRKGRAGEMFQH